MPEKKNNKINKNRERERESGEREREGRDRERERKKVLPVFPLLPVPTRSASTARWAKGSRRKQVFVCLFVFLEGNLRFIYFFSF